ncbi:MAG: ABC transporter permease [Chloroflexi bacterium]|nr:ABC transporter permease [Chloroflexota bacterium]
MALWDSLKLALGALKGHKLRSFLTVLGIVIGITSVISLLSVGKGAQAQVEAQVGALGTNLLMIQPGATSEGGVRSAVGSAASLTLDDAEALAWVDGVDLVAPEANTFSQLVSLSGNMRARVVATTAEYESVRNLSVTEGEFLNGRDVDARSMVAVIGANVAQTLFPDSDAVGQSLRLNNRPFQVIGVLESKGGTATGFQDDMVVVPLTTYQYRLQAQRTTAGRQSVQTIYVQLRDKRERQQVTESIAEVLRERHRIAGEDDFVITSQEDILRALQQVTGVFTIVLGAIASISLLVAGIGVMNIMLVAVAERTREIGIRKAMGARRRDIMLQFLMEAVVLTFLGGGLGVASGWGVSRLISMLNISGMSLGRQSISTVLSPDTVLLALGVSVAVGIFFGVYPAYRAARLHPVEALRYE